MKLLVSACLVGTNCKYNGKNNKNEAVLKYLEGKEYMTICPELLTGLPIPRPCVELAGGRLIDDRGNDVDELYRHGVELALQQLDGEEIALAILQSRSPTCGVNQVYDGTFSGRLVAGQGLFAKALKERGIRVVDAEDMLQGERPQE